MLQTWANSDGTQKIENTGPLTVKRTETVDEEFLDASLKFIEKAQGDGKPFFVWWNSHPHARLHAPQEGVLACRPTAWRSTTGTSACSSTSSSRPPYECRRPFTYVPEPTLGQRHSRQP